MHALKSQIVTSKVELPAERVERRILSIRGHKVMLDFDLAALYEVETKVLNQAVKRNIKRFPEDFMFQLTPEEADLVQEFLDADRLRSQFVTSNKARGGRRYPPLAFTEHGVAMLSGVLRSPRAIQVNIAIMRAFVKLRQILATHEDLSRRLEEMESRYDQQFRAVFDAIGELMAPEEQPRRPIGFAAEARRKDVLKKPRTSLSG